jgi:hypothetical protein
VASGRDARTRDRLCGLTLTVGLSRRGSKVSLTPLFSWNCENILLAAPLKVTELKSAADGSQTLETLAAVNWPI